MIVIFSTHGAHSQVLLTRKLEPAAVHLPARGASYEKDILTHTNSTFLSAKTCQIVKLTMSF